MSSSPARKSADRPRLPSEREAVLRPVDEASAQCYAVMEDTARQFKALASKIEESRDAIPIEELMGDTSVVRHIEDLKAKTKV